MTEKKKTGDKMTAESWLQRLHRGEFRSATLAYRSMGGSASHNGWSEADKAKASKAVGDYFSEEPVVEEVKKKPAKTKEVTEATTEEPVKAEPSSSKKMSRPASAASPRAENELRENVHIALMSLVQAGSYDEVRRAALELLVSSLEKLQEGALQG